MRRIDFIDIIYQASYNCGVCYQLVLFRRLLSAIEFFKKHKGIKLRIQTAARSKQISRMLNCVKVIRVSLNDVCN